MQTHGNYHASNFITSTGCFVRKCLFRVLSFGPMPNHIAFVMDGNRRFAKNQNIEQGGGHRVGFAALISILQYCYEMGVKYVTVYAFSIDNFRRKPNEVHSVMDLMKEKIEELLKEESIIAVYNVRINFWGDLSLLNEPVKIAAQEAMARTAKNAGPVLSVCVAYTSTNEIAHAIQKSCIDKIDSIKKREKGYANGHNDNDATELISVADLEAHLYTADCPDPDIVVRTSGETRLSNFLLWQTAFSQLQSPQALWPEFSLRHLVWSILEYQKVYRGLEEVRIRSRRKQ